MIYRVRKIRVFVNGNPIAFETVRASFAHNGQVSTLILATKDVVFNIGDLITVDIEFDGTLYRLFYGYVKEKSYSVPNKIEEISVYDVLVRAKDYFIASSTPDTAYKANNISAEDLVRDILNMAGITNFQYDISNFTFAINTDIEVNLVGALDFTRRIADIIAFTIWADKNGVVQFRNRRPYVMTGDTPSFYLRNGIDILSYRYTASDRDLRNRVVIYGNNVYAEAKAASPYLPAGYYKTVVLASPLINSQTFADKAAQYNLELLNRLTEELTLEVEGHPVYEPWKVANVSGISSQVDGDWYIYSVEHNIDPDGGYTCNMVLRR